MSLKLCVRDPALPGGRQILTVSPDITLEAFTQQIFGLFEKKKGDIVIGVPPSVRNITEECDQTTIVSDIPIPSGETVRLQKATHRGVQEEGSGSMKIGKKRKAGSSATSSSPAPSPFGGGNIQSFSEIGKKKTKAKAPTGFNSSSSSSSNPATGSPEGDKKVRRMRGSGTSKIEGIISILVASYFILVVY